MKITAEDLVEVPVERLVPGEQYFVSDYGANEAIERGLRNYIANGMSTNNVHWDHWYELRQRELNLDGLEIDFREWELWVKTNIGPFTSIFDEDLMKSGFKYFLHPRRHINPELERLKAERAELDRKIKELEGGK